MIKFEKIDFKYEEGLPLVFKDLSLDLPDGIISFIGQNATGKSTLLLLAAGRLLPGKGRILIGDVDTKKLKSEEERNNLASFIHQNMEFETEENIGSLLETVYNGGKLKGRKPGFAGELIRIFELDRVLDRKMQELSKGEIQRVILAFSLLYGSKTIMMDEPIFALEEHQKQVVMEFIAEHARKENLNIYYSIHELDISRKYSDYILLFYKDKHPVLGTTEEIFKPGIIEKAYDVPFALLKTKESLFRQGLLRVEEVKKTGGKT